MLVPMYTRIFTTDQYGVVTEMYAYVAFLIVVLTYGMETAFFRFSSKTENKTEIYSFENFDFLFAIFENYCFLGFLKI